MQGGCPRLESAGSPRDAAPRFFVFPRCSIYHDGVVVIPCPKCAAPNRERVQFCIRCHTPLRVVCPACAHGQEAGTTCEKCGVDFEKYGLMKLAALQTELEQGRRRSVKRTALAKAILLAPVTLGWSLLFYARSHRRD